ncbi:MAG TPA: hypothetical protein VM657_08725 [Sphingomonas sp.]|nr:hypothetical protein [Sphingomonas sp.]
MTRIMTTTSLAFFAMLGGCNQSPAPADNAATTPAPIANEADATAAESSWAGLRDLIGQYPRDSGLFESSVIAGDLKALLGDKLATFMQDMEVQGPLAEEKGVLWTSGNKTHQGGIDAAYLLIDPATRQLEVGLWENGVLQTYASPGAPLTKPADVETLIANARQTR